MLNDQNDATDIARIKALRESLDALEAEQIAIAADINVAAVRFVEAAEVYTTAKNARAALEVRRNAVGRAIAIVRGALE